MNNQKFADRYFLWKNPELRGADDQWIILTKDEYIAFRNVEDLEQRKINRSRRFVQTEDDEQGNRTSAFEVPVNVYRKWDREQHREKYQKTLRGEDEVEIISFDAPITNNHGETFCLYDILPDTSSEDEKKEELIMMMLDKAMETLTKKQREAIRLVYLENEEGKSVSEIAKINHIAQTTLNERVERAKCRLHKWFEENKKVYF